MYTQDMIQDLHVGTKTIRRPMSTDSSIDTSSSYYQGYHKREYHVLSALL